VGHIYPAGHKRVKAPTKSRMKRVENRELRIKFGYRREGTEGWKELHTDESCVMSNFQPI
jgi:hypothetical protein